MSTNILGIIYKMISQQNEPYKYIISIDDLSHIDRSIGIIVLFSGGLDSTFQIAQLKRSLGFQRVYPIFVKLGQEDCDISFKNIEEALDIRIHSIDLTNRFLDQFILTSLFATETYAGFHPLSASFSRPLLAEAAVTYAHDKHAGVILHSATKTQNTFRRLQQSLSNLGFSGHFGSTFYDSLVPREEKIDYLSEINLRFPKTRLYSTDENIWCREIESSRLDNIENLEIPEHFYKWTHVPPDHKSKVEPITITFEHGCPIAINHKALPFKDVLNQLNSVVGSYGIGRILSLEENQDGNKFPEFREAPAATILYDAYHQLEHAVYPYDVIINKKNMGQQWIKEVVEGRWHSTYKRSLDAAFDVLRQKISGTVHYTLSHQAFQLQQLTAADPLYGISRENHVRTTVSSS